MIERKTESRIVQTLLIILFMGMVGCGAQSSETTDLDSSEDTLTSPPKTEMKPQLSDFEKALQNPTEVKKLVVHDNEKDPFLEHVEEFSQLKELFVKPEMNCEELDQISQLTTLTYLMLSNIGCQEPPTSLGNLQQLESITWTLAFETETMPTVICELANLKSLHVEGFNLKYFPPEIGQLKQVEDITTMYSPIKSYPDELGEMTQLKEVYYGVSDPLNAQLEELKNRFPGVEFIPI